MAPLKVLISGGGVAGTSLAFWLTKLGHNVTLVERYPTLRTTGLQIDLRGHGIKVLKHMGLEKAFREHAAPEEGMQFIDRQGRSRAYMKANKTGEGPQTITSEYEIMRGDLCRIIFNATGDRAKYVFGTSVTGYRDVDNGVEVTWKDGKQEHFDLFVGADGVYSQTRKMMLGADAEKAFHSVHESNAYLTYKQPMAKGERYDGMMYLATQRRAILTRRHNPDEMQLYMLLNRDDERLSRVRRGDVEAEKQAFAEIFADAGWCAPELIEHMKASDDFYCEHIGVVKMDAWHQGHVALLGDAGYGPGGSGMGTTCAIIGAYVLAGEISKSCDSSSDQSREGLKTALKAYDDTFRPFMDKIQKGLENPPSWIMPSSAWAIALTHYVLEAMVFIGIMRLAALFTRESEDCWRLPEYEKMPPVETLSLPAKASS